MMSLSFSYASVRVPDLIVFLRFRELRHDIVD